MLKNDQAFTPFLLFPLNATFFLLFFGEIGGHPPHVSLSVCCFSITFFLSTSCFLKIIRPNHGGSLFHAVFFPHFTPLFKFFFCSVLSFLFFVSFFYPFSRTSFEGELQGLSPNPCLFRTFTPPRSRSPHDRSDFFCHPIVRLLHSSKLPRPSRLFSFFFPTFFDPFPSLRFPSDASNPGRCTYQGFFLPVGRFPSTDFALQR